MPRLTMLVDMTASASRPGTRKSGGVDATAPKNTSSTTGHDQRDQQALASPKGQNQLHQQLSQECPHVHSVAVR